MKRPKPFVVGDVRVRATRPPTKRGPEWEWRAVHNREGERVSVWSGRASRDDAIRIVTGLVNDGEHRRQRGPRSGVDDSVQTVRDLLECWLFTQEQRADLADSSKAVQRASCVRLGKHAGDVRLDRLDLATMEAYRDRSGYAGRTVRLDLGFLRAASTWGHARGLPCPRELPDLRLNIRRRYNDRTPEHREVVAVLAQLDGWHRLAVLLLAATGARVGEVASLTWERVDLAAREITVIGKTGKRVVPVLDADVIDALRAARDAAAEPAGRLWSVGHDSVRSGVLQVLDRACDAAGVLRFTSHGLRRYVVTRLIDSGVDPAIAAEVTGHSIAVAMRLYREVTPSRVREAVKRARLGAFAGAEVVELFRAGND